eukprot:8398320-Pyramimonas_sp.AAC.1
MAKGPPCAWPCAREAFFPIRDERGGAAALPLGASLFALKVPGPPRALSCAGRARFAARGR